MGAVIGLWLMTLGSVADDAKVILVTYGPRDDVQGHFGHSVLWVRSESRNVNGFFNLALRGPAGNDLRTWWEERLTYRAIVRASADDLSGSLAVGRSVRFQALALGPAAVDRLLERLREAVDPTNNPFTYDYLTRNCTTRIRDLLDEVLGGRLREAMTSVPSARTPREHILSRIPEPRRAPIGFLLGAPADRSPSRWEEAFLPALLAEALSEVRLDGEPLVTADRRVIEGVKALYPEWRGHPWPLWLSGAALATLFAVTARWVRRRCPGTTGLRAAGLLPALWWLALGTAGAVLVFNRHGQVGVAMENANLWLASPAYLLLFAAWVTWLARLGPPVLSRGSVTLGVGLVALGFFSALLHPDHERTFWLCVLLPPSLTGLLLARAVTRALPDSLPVEGP